MIIWVMPVKAKEGGAHLGDHSKYFVRLSSTTRVFLVLVLCILLNTTLGSLNQNGTHGFLISLNVKALQCSCESINGNFLYLRRPMR
jgi:hypothetical protein